MKYMTKAQAVAAWRKYVKPVVVQFHGSNDKYALRESWNDMTDSLAKDGRITWQQCYNWTPPKECS